MPLQSFFDWWYAPWSYARDVTVDRCLEVEGLARRDGYRLWCRQADVVPDFPARFDPAWHAAASTSGNAIGDAARLFAGLVAVRQGQHVRLAELPPGERGWCVSIAATQPLRMYTEALCAPEDGLELCGLVELAGRLESRFPGMWSRLRLLLPFEQRAHTQRLLEAMPPVRESDTAAMRGLRCWRHCSDRAARAAQAMPGAQDLSPPGAGARAPVEEGQP